MGPETEWWDEKWDVMECGGWITREEELEAGEKKSKSALELEAEVKE